MKRILCVILILIMMIPPMVLPAAAAEAAAVSSLRLQADKTEGIEVGDEVTVSVVAENIYHCGGVQLAMTYDPEYLEPALDAETSEPKFSYEELAGYKDRNLYGAVPETLSKELAGQRAVVVASAATSTCFDGNGSITAVTFKVLKKAAAPGIPMELVASMINQYDSREMNKTIQIANTHIAAVDAAKTIQSVELIEMPAKTNYVQGQALDLTGGKLLVSYSDSSSQEVRLSLATITAYDCNQAGAQTVKATYGGKEISFSIQVAAKQFTSLAIGAIPNKIEYLAGTASLSLTGGVLLKNYSSGDCETIDMTDASVSVSGYKKDTLGFQTITLTVGELSTSFLITVVKKAVSTIAVVEDAANPLKTSYVVGQQFDCTNGRILVTYKDSTSEEIAMVPEMIRSFDSSITGKRDIEICYGAANCYLSVSVQAKAVSAIAIHTMPAKTTYVKGQSVDVSGGKLLVTYNDGSEKVIDMGSSGVTVESGLLSNGTFPSTGTYILTVKYKSQTTQYSVTVIPKEVASIALYSAPTKTEYIQGQPLNLDGGLLKVTYNNGEVKYELLSLAVVEGYDAQSIGEQTLVVTYSKASTTMKVNVIAKVVESIVVTSPGDVEYVEGQPLNLVGGSITATYNDGDVKTVPLAEGTISGYNAKVLGEQTVSVTYGGKTGSFKVNVIAKAVSSIAVTAPTKTTYVEGQDLVLIGGSIIATYNDGDTQTVPLSEGAISGYEEIKNTVGTHEVTVAYGGKTTTFEVTIIAKALTKIEVLDYQAQYERGAELDYEAGYILATYNDESTAEIRLNDGSVVISGYQKDQIGTQSLTVSYGGKQATISVLVYDPVVGISLAAAPHKTEYVQGQALDLTGGKITVTYATNATEDLDLSAEMIAPGSYNKEQLGPQTVTITYGGFTASFEVTVVAKAVSAIEVTAPAKTTYVEGQDLVLIGGSIKAIYNDGDEQIVSLAEGTISGYEEIKNTIGDHNITVTYEGESNTFGVTIIAKAVDSIAVSAPAKTEYVQGQALVLDGGSIIATYNDSDNQTVPLSEGTISGYEEIKNTVGTHNVTVTYEGKSNTFAVTIIAKAVEAIEVSTLPTKTEYVQSQPFDAAGGVLKVTYNDGDVQYAPLSEAAISGYNAALLGEQTLTAVYQRKSAEFEVTVVAKAVASIKVTAPTKTTYVQALPLDLVGGTITATYNDGDTQTVPLAEGTISGYEEIKNIVGTHKVTVTYGGQSDTFIVEIIAKKVVDMEITTLPDKVDYLEVKDSTLQLAGGEITIHYDNDTIEYVPLSKAKVTGFDCTKVGTQELKVTYLSKVAYFSIYVQAKTAERIAITTKPTKLEYVQGEELNLSGGKLTIYYDNDTKKVISLSEADEISGFSSMYVGNRTVYVAHDGFEASFTVKIIEEHVYSNACDKTCNICGAKRTVPAHKYSKVTTKATLTKDGKIQSKCTVCGYVASKTTVIKAVKSFKLSTTAYTYNGKVRTPNVTVKDSAGTTLKKNTDYTVTYAAGRKNAGTYKVTVKMIGKYSGTKTLTFKINPISISKCSVKLSATAYTYNGKVKTPSVTVKNAGGTKLTKNTHYTVTYASGRKNVGKYKVTIKMKGNYSGTKTLYFTIKPQAASIKSLTAKKKALTVKINRRLTQSTGYQIQYSTTKSFKSYKTKTVGYKISSTVLSGLKAKTTYYVRIRTYKTVNGTKYYSSWSTIKYKKTK